MKTTKTSRADLRAALTSASDYALRSLRRVHTLSALAPHLLTHPLVLRTYRTLRVALAADRNDAGPWVDISQTADVVRFGATLYELDSLKDERLLQALEPFADSTDWTAGSTDWTYSDRPNRDYSFTQRVELDRFVRSAALPAPLCRALLRAGDLAPQAFDLRVVICAYVKSDSPLCRVVVKGIEEKIVREEIKEIVCA
jgi:hypothetical protein